MNQGRRKYAETDPLFGRRCEDDKAKVEVAVGNKTWHGQKKKLSVVID